MMNNEARLVRRLQARESAAMGELYDCFGTMVYRITLRIVRNTAAAEDVTQETFLSIWNGIGTFDAKRGTLSRWIGIIARSRAIDYLRKTESRVERHRAPLEEAERFRVQPADLGGAVRLERVQMLQNPWKKLKRQERTVLRLAHWWGLSQAEIADRLNCPLGTIKTWMRSGHRSLRAALEG